MAPFTYDTPPPSPLVGSIGDLIARGGLQRAQLAEALAQTQSRAQVANAQAWGNATQSLGQLPIQMQEQARRDQLANVDTAYKLTQMQGAQAQLADQQQQRARRLAAGLALQKSITANTDPTTGEIDAQKVFTDVSGPFPDDADAWLKSYSGAQSAFDARAKSKRADADAESVLVGRLAQAAPSAAAFVDSLATAQAADHVSKKTLARVTQDLATTNAWDPLKAQYVSTADALLPPVTLKDGETLVNAVSNTPRAEQPKEIKVDPGQKIYQGTNPDGTPKLLVTGGDKPPTVSYSQEAIARATAAGRTVPNLDDITAAQAAQDARDRAKAAAEHVANRNYDVANPVPVKAKSQDELEQEARTVLRAAMSNRSGGIGQEDQKVRQANHLLGVLEQFKDPKTGAYNIPRAQYNELALGLATLIAPGGNVGIETMNQINQHTAKGDVAGLLTYLTGQPVAANTQAITNMLHDSIVRQGQIAVKNRQAELSYLRGQIPTDLEQSRRDALTATEMVPLQTAPAGVDELRSR